MKMLILTRFGRKGASSRMRSLQFLPHYEKAGITCTVQALIPDELLNEKYAEGGYHLFRVAIAYWRRLRTLLRREKFDLVWVEKEVFPWLPLWFDRWLLRGAPYILDYDDAIFHNYDAHRSAVVRYLLGRKLDSLMTEAAIVVAGNPYLAERARRSGATRVETLPTAIDLNRYPIRSKPVETSDEGREYVVGWIGSPTTIPHLDLLAKPLAQLGRLFRFRLRVICAGNFDLSGVKVENLPWSEPDEVSSLQGCDVGVMPLHDTPFARGKCGYKLIQYMACRLPVIASPVGVNKEIVRPGVNGFLAECDAEWVIGLSRLFQDSALRIRMGEAGREQVRKSFSVEVVAPHQITMIRRASAT